MADKGRNQPIYTEVGSEAKQKSFPPPEYDYKTRSASFHFLSLSH
jgi:hypothetical protein